MFSQVAKDTLSVDYIYAPNSFNHSFSAEESWEIHKAAYIKQLKSKGLTDDEIKKRMVTYEKDKEEFIAQVKEQHRLAAIQRKKADDLRKLADIERKKADEQRKLADIQRAKADKQRKKAQEWRKKAENILIKNITLSNKSNNSKPITFKVNSKMTLYIGIRAHISSGTTLIEIYNPKGIKEGELSLNFKSNSDSNEEREGLEYTSGALDKTISGAEVGEWKIKIVSQKSEGIVAMSVAQYIKPTMDE